MPSRSDRHREERAKHAAEAQPNPSPYGLSRRTRRALAHEIAHSTEIGGAGIRTNRRGTNRRLPKPQRRARAKA